MHVVIFEDSQWPGLMPLSLSRPVFTLASGMTTLLVKQIRHTRPTRLTLWVRPAFVEMCERRLVRRLAVPTRVNAPLDGEPALLVNGRTLFSRAYRYPEQEAAAIDEGGVVRAALVTRKGLTAEDALQGSGRWRELAGLPAMPPQVRLVDRVWDLLKYNEESLAEDYVQVTRPVNRRPEGSYHVMEEEKIYVGEGTSIEPGVVLDARKGPIVVDHQAIIGANSVVQGPCYIGPTSQVMPLSFVRPGTSIGTMCKIGGHVSASIFMSYSNKAHEGFVGDSYVGRWVNLGALTTTSNLKNTYGEISSFAVGGEVNTGRRFLGSLIGDHAKTGITTRLMGGTYVGFASMVAESGIAPKFVPSFQFRTDKGAEPYRLEKAIEVMKAVISRRNRTWDAMDDRLVRYVAETAAGLEGRTG